ncbi:aspartic proteinase CDR1-like [Malus domestica]|uniref:aspartic proteinase CDR1-like n=1 Tax=Malus domestica TaxID=3750 RepID=UPI0010AA4AF6|nr:aspartic proteinase CDR1-like [Malus domestica]
MASTLIFSLVALISIITVPSSMSSPKASVKGFEVRLIHRDSPASPLYNPRATRADLIKSSGRRTIARQNYFNWLMSNKTWSRYSSSYVWAPIDQSPGDYIMRFKVGTPEVETFGVFDTGSHLTWLQCEPCEQCFSQTITIYNPASSQSYEKAMCGSVVCNTASGARCPNPKGECKYEINYMDGSFTEGDVATETITLEDDGLSGSISLQNIIIGCGHSNVDTTAGYPAPGIVGLSRQPSSLVSQIPLHRVSYCIPSKYKGNHSSVRFGSAAVIKEEETQTSLLSGQYGLYQLSLEGISIDGTLLNISRSVFDMTGDRGGVFMDSATTFTLLAFDAFIEFKLGMMNALSDFKPVTDVDGLFPLCYDYHSGFRLDITPEIVFHFTGLDFPLGDENTWIMNSEGNLCLAMGLNEGSSDYTIFGMYQQQNVNVGYDLDNNIVSLKYGDCE